MSLLAAIALACLSQETPWQDVLGPTQAVLPEPSEGAVVWREDLAGALAEAKKTGRPLFVTMRCLPCKQCAEFDKDVLEGGNELDPLLRSFVTVRLTTMRGVDARLLPFDAGYQDLDLSWWGYLLSPEGSLYGVYGGRDHVSDATRISLPVPGQHASACAHAPLRSAAGKLAARPAGAAPVGPSTNPRGSTRVGVVGFARARGGETE